jgi:type VI secretion system protein VasD
MRTLGTHHSSYGRTPAAVSRRLALGCGLVLAGVLTAGCASKPVVTPVSITLLAAPDANPDARGRASPLTVRVYALKTPSPFEGADFFSLFEKDQATLGAELVQREEMLLRPGESKKLELTLPPDAKAIGVMAAFRDLDRARWREVRALEVGKPQTLTVTFGARQIRVESK